MYIIFMLHVINMSKLQENVLIIYLILSDLLFGQSKIYSNLIFKKKGIFMAHHNSLSLL